MIKGYGAVSLLFVTVNVASLMTGNKYFTFSSASFSVITASCKAFNSIFSANQIQIKLMGNPFHRSLLMYLLQYQIGYLDFIIYLL